MKNLNEFEHSAPEHDPVKKHYQLLPYPPVEESKLNDEERFYKESNHTKTFLPQHALENINHYLHRGKETFA